MSQKQLALLGLLLFLPLVALAPVWFLQCTLPIQQEVSGKLKQAADANTVVLAEQKLTEVVDYLEAHELTSGHSNFLWFTPSCDVEYWYTNLQQARDELRTLPTDAAPLESSNQLIKGTDLLGSPKTIGPRKDTP